MTDVTDLEIDLSTPQAALEVARELCVAGDYRDAIEITDVAMQRFSEADDRVRARLHGVAATAQLCLGELVASGGRAAAAIELLEAAGDGAELGDALHTRAVVLLHQGKIDEATPLLDRAAKLLDKAGDVARADFCSVLLTMAEVASASGVVDEAKALCERVIGEMTSVQPSSEEHAAELNRVTARAFLGLGSAYGQSGATDEAKDYLERAVDFFDAGYGHGHPEMTAGLTEIAAIYRAIGDDDAAAVIEEELAVVRRVGSEDQAERQSGGDDP